MFYSILFSFRTVALLMNVSVKMKPDEHLPNIYGDPASDRDSKLSDGEREDRPSPLDRHFARGRSQVSNNRSSHSSTTLGTPTKLPCIDSHSRSVTSVFSLRESPPSKQHSVMVEERRLCRSPSCPNLPLIGPGGNGRGDEEDIRLPVLTPKALTKRPPVKKDFNLLSENHRRLKARAAIATTLAGAKGGGRSFPEEATNASKNAMLLPLRENGPEVTQSLGLQRKLKMSSELPATTCKKDRKRKTLSPEEEEPDPSQGELDISHSDMKCLIWLAEVKANQADLKEVT